MVAKLALLSNLGPSSEETERAVLAALWIDDGLIPQALEVLTDDHFAAPRNRAIWRATLRAWEEHRKVDLLLIRDQLARHGELDAAGGVPYLAQLDLDLPDVTSWDSYVDVLEERRVRRAMWEAGHRLIRTAEDRGEDSRSLLAAAQERLLRVEVDRGRAGLESLGGVVDRVNARLDLPAGEVSGLTTGFRDLDSVVLGWEPGNLVLVAGRPGMGKSVFVKQAGLAAAKAGKHVAIFSLEMTAEEYALRMISAETGVLHERLRRRTLHREEWERVNDCAAALATLPLRIDDGASLTPQLLMARAMRAQREHGLDLVVVDHVQLMAAGERTANENEATSVVSRSLKALAKTCGVPVIACSQLSRRVDERSDKRPLLSDLRASGSLEQDADTVLFLYRAGYYRADRGEDDSEAEVIVAKQRAGRTGIVPLVWQGDRMRFLSREVRR